MADNTLMKDVAFSFGAYSRSIQHGTPCGDAYYFHSTYKGLLFTLIDGLGHGELAQHASFMAVKSIKKNAERPLEEIVWQAHRDIRDSRGCVAFIGRVDFPSFELECVNIGNILCRLYSETNSHPISRPGILGHNVKKIFVNRASLAAGDRIVLCTDGVSTRFDLNEVKSEDLDDQARELIDRFGHAHDDASSVVINIG